MGGGPGSGALGDGEGGDSSGIENGNSDGTSRGEIAENDPGFGDDLGGDDALPSLVDEEPLYSSSSDGSSSSNPTDSANGKSSTAGASGTGGGNSSETSAHGQVASEESGSNSETAGTRAQGGLEPDWDTSDTTMTAEERVAILDKRLKAGTGVFDEIIKREHSQQRSSRREQQSNQDRGLSSQDIDAPGRNPYEESEAEVVGSAGNIKGPNTTRKTAPSVRYEPPDDIGSSDEDDDIVARQLREAAMREPDPEIRKALWNEYRKYKGIEIPEG